MIAARKQDLPMVRLLLKHGADVHEEVNKQTERYNWGATPASSSGDDAKTQTEISVALGTGNAAIIELLKSKGAKTPKPADK